MKNLESNPSVNLDTTKGWNKLKESEQKVVRDETKALTEALNLKTESELEVGRHLTELRKILEPKRMFISHLDTNFGMSRATAYRYMELYTVTKKKLPKPVLEVAMRRGYRPVQLKIIENNPPPKTSDPIVIGKYLDKIERMPREVKPEATPHNPDTLLKECINFASSRFDKLPRNSKTRIAWVRSLIGMLMTKFGLGTEQPFEPLAIPDTFRHSRGRPKNKAA
jgi:hypothetical protein